MQTLAIIPARGGSKGIPNKNIKLIGGKPLIAWSIEQALASSFVDRVVVTTDSEEISIIAKDYGAEVPFIRPSSLALDTSTTESAMLHCLEWLEEFDNYQPDATVLLQPTSPVRSKNSIDNAIELYFQNKCDSVLSVCEFWHFLWRNNKAPVAEYDYRNRPRRQDIQDKDIRYKENGSIYISKTNLLKKDMNRLCGNNIGLYLMTESESYEIDSYIDWMVVESILVSGGTYEN
ncbi:acylneuraminate cytidylyltransferase family protein [Saccharospirillum sp.]|uniref:acylneuraminate cytidylyltransferase family protein n=1 Tax=Saccharospirillum sp. TaxID=2033801 RepID=UPI0032993B0E